MSSASAGPAALRIRIAGQVQGVGFRAWAVREARARNLRGWVRNRADGTVEALLIGEPGSIEAMVEACRRGPRLAAVSDVAREAALDDGSAGFSERGTA